jgi:hypothetical protein
MRIWKLYKVCWCYNRKRKRRSKKKVEEEGKKEKKTGHPFSKFLINQTEDIQLQ